MTTSATLPAAGGTTGAPSGGPLRIPAAGVEQHVEHQRHVLLWQARGAAEVRLTTESSVQTVPGAVMGVVTVYEGQALWIPVRTSHELRVHPDSVTVPLGFEAADWGTILREPTLLTVDRDLQHLMLAQHVTSSSAISSAADITRQLLALIEKAPMVSEDLPMPPDGPARQVAEQLRFDPGDTRSVEELAQTRGLSARSGPFCGTPGRRCASGGSAAVWMPPRRCSTGRSR